MPWHVSKRGGKFCVVKDGTSSPVPGGCHATRAEAEAHKRALYANESDASPTAEEGTVMDVQQHTGTTNQAPSLTFTGEWDTILGQDGKVIGFRVPEGATVEEEAQPVEADEKAWEGVLGVIGHPTSDRRFLIPDEIFNRDLPLPFNVQIQTDEGHDSSVNAGRIDMLQFIRMGDFGLADEFPLGNVPEDAVVIWGSGVLDGSEAAAEAERLIANGYGVSLDLPADRIAYFDPETLQEVPPEELDEMAVFFGEYLHGIGGKIGGVTVVNVPAFEEATVRLADGTPLVASASVVRIVEADRSQPGMTRMVTPPLVAAGKPAKPPREAFRDPGFHELTPLTISEPDERGFRRVYGHLADWDGCHTGFTNVCVPPFRSDSDYAYFNVGEIECDDGTVVPIGKLMFSSEGIGHASTDPNVGAREAAAHYDNHTKIGAYVRAGADRFGTWLAGVIRPDLPEEDLAVIRANPPSGDWRPIPGKSGSELVAAFSVPVPGFPIPRMMIASGAMGLTIITGPLDLTPGPRALRREFEVLKRRRKRWGMAA